MRIDFTAIKQVNPSDINFSNMVTLVMGASTFSPQYQYSDLVKTF